MAEGDKMRGKRIRKPETWTTENEISYLSGIGTWGKVAHSRKEILQGYIDSALRRDNWDEVDGNKVIMYAKQMLAEL